MPRRLHPVLLLGAAVLAASLLTWLLPAGEYQRRDDPSTLRRVVVAGTYHPVPASPVSPLRAVVALPRGFVAAADVVGVILFVGGAWVVVDRLGTLGALVGWLVGRFRSRARLLIVGCTLFFGVMGALENMQEEIVALVPALVALGACIGVDAVTVVAMSAGAAMVGSAFGPTNPFQAGIALKLAGLPSLSAVGIRTTMFAAAMAIWCGWTLRQAARQAGVGDNGMREEGAVPADAPDLHVRLALGRHLVVFALVVAPMAAYVYGALRLDWGFNELSAAFIVGTLAAGLVGGLGWNGTVAAYFSGMEVMLPSALMVGVARAISLVLEDAHVVDTLLHGLAGGLAGLPRLLASLLMVAAHAAIHVAVPSVSGQAVLTMPVFAPLADVLGLPRDVAVLAYQTGAGLTELLTPTNGALMAILLAAGVPLGRWLRFAAVGVLLLALVGVLGMAAAG